MTLNDYTSGSIMSPYLQRSEGAAAEPLRTAPVRAGPRHHLHLDRRDSRASFASLVARYRRGRGEVLTLEAIPSGGFPRVACTVTVTQVVRILSV